MSLPEIKALIFDFGGVILDMGWQKMSEIETNYGMKPGSFRHALWGHEVWKQREVGTASLEAYAEAVQRELERAAGRPVPEAVSDWWAYKRLLNEDLLTLLARLRGQYKIGLLSNADEQLERRLQEDLKIFDRFDDVIISATVRMAKPDPRIFALAAQRLGVDTRGCVFVDDLQRNIAAAVEAGMHGIHYLGDNAGLFAEFRTLGVPVKDHELEARAFYEMPAEWKVAMAARNTYSA